MAKQSAFSRWTGYPGSTLTRLTTLHLPKCFSLAACRKATSCSSSRRLQNERVTLELADGISADFFGRRGMHNARGLGLLGCMNIPQQL